MGYFRTLFKGPAYYAYQVRASPEEAVRRAVESPQGGPHGPTRTAR